MVRTHVRSEMSSYNPRFTARSAPAPRSGYDGVAVASLVTAILLIPFVPIILGFVGRARCRRSGKQGMGVSMTAIVLGVVAVIIWMAFIVAFMTVYMQEFGG